MTPTPSKATKAKAVKPRAKKVAATVETRSGIKGTKLDLTCKGYQFAAGQTFEHKGSVKVCRTGFHACSADAHPLEVFGYYAPGTSRYFDVTQQGPFSTNDDVKICSAKITIGVELSISELTKRAIEWVFARAKKSEGSSATGYQGAASATGYRGAASATGDQGAASATGTQGAAMACGYDGCVSGKDGNALFALERDNNWNIVSTASGIVGKGGLRPDTWYVCKGGKLVEAAQ